MTLPDVDDADAHEEVRFLDDVKVLEISNLGAEPARHAPRRPRRAKVIKIEPPKRGDATRLIAPRPGFSDSGLHRRWNRGKKSVAIDMTASEGVEVFLRLVPQVDIVIEGLRPGALEKMGVPWSRLTELNPTLVMIAISGWGQAGPYRDMPSHGIGFDAVSGLATVEDDDRGRPRVITRHVNTGTLLSPLFGAAAALAALSWSRRNHRPVFLDVALADAAVFANIAVEDRAAMRSAEAAGTVPPSVESGRGAFEGGGQASTMQSYRTRDGKVLLLMALERKFFVRLVDAVGRPDLLSHVPEDQYLVRGNEEIDDAMVKIIGVKGPRRVDGRSSPRPTCRWCRCTRAAMCSTTRTSSRASSGSPLPREP